VGIDLAPHRSFAGTRKVPRRSSAQRATSDVADLEISHGCHNTIAFARALRRLQRLHDGRATAKAGSADIINSRIQIVADGDTFELAMCRQCGDPKCVSNCPAAALAKDDADGTINWDGSKCVNCLLCTVGCAFGGIVYNAAAGHVVKCDSCGGDPVCVKACDRGALKYLTTANIYNEVGDLEDLFVPGLAGCQGCNTELIMRHALRRIGPDTVLATPPGCIPAWVRSAVG
jgi:phenylglyoxylate dehydrogenase beta subunit